MKNAAIFFGAALAFLLMASAQAADNPVEFAGEADPDGIDTTGADMAIPQATDSGMDTGAQISAFLAVIRQFEANHQYDVLYGGGHFYDFSRHPNTRIAINLPGYEGKYSTAAGAYQINFPTYKEFAAKIGVTDFSPETQDALALAILKTTGAIDAIVAGDIPLAFSLAAPRWASLPGSKANQHPQNLQTALNYFEQFGGVYA